MSTVFETYKGKPTTYKVKRNNNADLELGWKYKWYVVSSLSPLETGFYTIDGIEPSTWTSQSCVTITYKRNTSTNPYETFRVYCDVQIVTNGVLTCETSHVADVVVRTDTSEIMCNGVISTVPNTNCIISGEKYIYQFCCTEDIEYVYFTVHNGKAYSLIGDVQYSTPSDPIKVAVDPIDHCAEIIVSWNIEDPSLVYLRQVDNLEEVINIGANYVITAFAEKQGKFSKMIIKTVKAVPPAPIVEVTGETQLSYSSGSNLYNIRVADLIRYPSDYYLIVKVRKTYEGGTTSDWTDIITPIKLSDLGTLVNSDGSIPYSYDISYYETLNDYVEGDPGYVDMEFLVQLYDSYVEPIYEYGYHPDNQICLTEAIIDKHVDFTHCATEVDIPFGTITNYITTCPTYVHLVWGVLVWVVVVCTQTIWNFSTVCYNWCYRTRWHFGNRCFVWCYKTIWHTSTVCYSWNYDKNTVWLWNRMTYHYTGTVNNGWIGKIPNDPLANLWGKKTTYPSTNPGRTSASGNATRYI